MAISTWGFEQRDIAKALPFMESIKNARGDKQAQLQVAKMTDQWRRRVSLILLQENSYALRAYDS